MSSLKIAELTRKEHRHVLQDITVMLEVLGVTQLRFERSYRDSTGRALPMFELPFDETMTVIAGYDAALRFKIVHRWRELERLASWPPQPTRRLASRPETLSPTGSP